MGDALKEIEVEHTAEVSLSLHVGGSFPYKSRLFEYPAGGGEPKPLETERTGAAPVPIGKVGKGEVRRFAWSVVVVCDDELEQTVDVTGHVHVASKMVGTVKGELPVKKPLQKCFVNVLVKGIVKGKGA